METLKKLIKNKELFDYAGGKIGSIEDLLRIFTYYLSNYKCNEYLLYVLKRKKDNKYYYKIYVSSESKKSKD